MKWLCWHVIYESWWAKCTTSSFVQEWHEPQGSDYSMQAFHISGKLKMDSLVDQAKQIKALEMIVFERTVPESITSVIHNGKVLES